MSWMLLKLKLAAKIYKDMFWCVKKGKAERVILYISVSEHLRVFSVAFLYLIGLKLKIVFILNESLNGLII